MAWEWRFPRDVVHACGGVRASKDLAAEVAEAEWELARIGARTSCVDARAAQAAAVELMDVIHVCETVLRSLEADYGADLEMAFCDTVAKNETRGYYGSIE